MILKWKLSNLIPNTVFGKNEADLVLLWRKKIFLSKMWQTLTGHKIFTNLNIFFQSRKDVSLKSPFRRSSKIVKSTRGNMERIVFISPVFVVERIVSIMIWIIPWLILITVILVISITMLRICCVYSATVIVVSIWSGITTAQR